MHIHVMLRRLYGVLCHISDHAVDNEQSNVLRSQFQAKTLINYVFTRRLWYERRAG